VSAISWTHIERKCRQRLRIELPEYKPSLSVWTSPDLMDA
jgi:hypothetical protein